MATSTIGSDLADIELRRIASITWPTIAVLYSVQAIASHPGIDAWQIAYIFGIAFTVGISLLIQRFTNFTYAFIPFATYMLVSPIFLENHSKNSWMSYGLLTVAASIYVATINPWPLAVISIIAVNGFQLLVVKEDLSIFTDSQDMNLLGGYFATIWSMGIGLLIAYIRNQYLEVSMHIENQIDSLKDSISTKLQGITKRNREDSRNLKLHGTVLNTLIYARNNSEFQEDRNAFVRTLKEEISELRTSASFETFESSIAAILEGRENVRVKIEHLSLSGDFRDHVLQNAYLEIVREILLNIEKHTSATSASLKTGVDHKHNFYIQISDNSLLDHAEKDRDQAIANATRSRSLSRLLAQIPAQLEISSDASGLIYRVFQISEFESKASSQEIYNSRNSGLLSFAFNLIKSVSIIGILYIPGYFLIDVRPIDSLFLISQSLALLLLAFKRIYSAFLLAISTWISIATPVFISLNVTSCSQITFAPWMANIVLTSTFAFALLSKRRVQRWVPLAIFTFELIILPLGFPQDCRNIFVGTLPGIPLIISFYLVIMSVRRRAFEEDAYQIMSAYEDESNIQKVESLLNAEFNSVISSLERFVQMFESSGQENISLEIDLEIQRLRAFLLCSEQYESKVVRDFYRFATLRLDENKSTRISLIGDHFFEQDKSSNFVQVLSALDMKLGDLRTEISLLSADGLTIEVAVEDPEGLKAKTSELSMDYPEVKLLIRSFT